MEGLTFSLIGGEGEPGGDAGVTLQLDNDDGSAVSAGRRHRLHRRRPDLYRAGRRQLCARRFDRIRPTRSPVGSSSRGWSTSRSWSPVLPIRCRLSATARWRSATSRSVVTRARGTCSRSAPPTSSSAMPSVRELPSTDGRRCHHRVRWRELRPRRATDTAAVPTATATPTGTSLRHPSSAMTIPTARPVWVATMREPVSRSIVDDDMTARRDRPATSRAKRSPVELARRDSAYQTLARLTRIALIAARAT